MPRVTEKAQRERHLRECWHTAAMLYTEGLMERIAEGQESDSEDEEEMEFLEDVVEVWAASASVRYSYRGEVGSAGRHESDILNNLIYRYSEQGFRALFRMGRESFWRVVRFLQELEGPEYWSEHVGGRGAPPRPAYQQIAVALYRLGDNGAGGEKSRIQLNIGYGSVFNYTRRVVTLLARNAGRIIRWPSASQRSMLGARDRIFQGCIGFLDGSEIPLATKPMKDPEQYYSRKKVYGFGLQAVCDWDSRFIYAFVGHTASVHNSAAFKYTLLYRNRREMFGASEYVLADKAYEIDRHVLTPFKMPQAAYPRERIYNWEHSRRRIEIEHSFGLLKARWGSLARMPLRIGRDAAEDTQRVVDWVLACMCLHNLLLEYAEDNRWLQDGVSAVMAREERVRQARAEGQTEGTATLPNAQMKRDGERLRRELLERCMEGRGDR